LITATKTDLLLVDNDGDGVVDPGDTIRYTVVIINSGTGNATNAAFDDTIDANTTLSGTFETTPIARNDSYASIGSVGISVPAGSGLLVNDNDPDGGSLTITSFDSTSSMGTFLGVGGEVTVNANGSFTYDPPPGFEGADSFSYTIIDDEGQTDPAFVSILVSDMIWFIDNGAGSPGDGRLNSPFDSLAAFDAANGNGGATDPEAGDNVFAYTGSGAYTGGVALESDQRLIGQGATASLETMMGITLPSHSNPLPTTGGSKPVITNGGGNGIDLATGNAIRGLNLGNSSGTGLAGTSVGTLTVSEVTVGGTGGGLDIDGGTLAVSLDSLEASSSTHAGIRLVNVNGSFDVLNGTISTTGQRAVSIHGSPSLALGVTLESVSANGGDHGIFLSDTTGSFTVTGIGSTDGSGGTIQATTGHGILLDNATDVSLHNMSVASASADGINAAGLTGKASVINTTIDGFAESGMEVRNSSGTLELTISATTFSNNQGSASGEEGLLLSPEGTSVMTVLIADASQFLDIRRQGVDATPIGNATLNLTVQDSTFNDTDAGDGAIKINPDGNGNASLTLSANTFSDSAGPHIFLKNDSTGTMAGTIQNNTMSDAVAPLAFRGIEVVHDDAGSSGPANGTTILLIDGNTIGDTDNDGILINAREDPQTGASPDVHVTIQGNTVAAPAGGFGDGFGSNAILVRSRDDTDLCADITGNIATGGPFGASAIRVQQEGSSSTFVIEGLSGGAAAFLDAVNPASTPPRATDNGGSFGVAGSCQLPSSTPKPTALLTTNGRAVVHDTDGAPPVRVASFVGGLRPFETAAVEGTHLLAKRSPGDSPRRAPGLARPAPVPLASGETINITLGDLNPGQVVTIVFDVTVDTSIPPNVTQVCNQGLFSGDNFVDTLTDDPGVGGSTDPTCTPVTVSLATGSIVINKITIPSGGTGFGFSDDIAAPNSFTLDDGQSQTFVNVPAGTYSVTESDPGPAYSLTDLTCIDPDGGSTANLGTRTATIDLDPGETVECTFTNSQPVLQPELWAVEYDWGDPPPGFSFAFPYFTSWLNARIENRGAGDAFNVTAEVMSWPANTTVPDPNITVGDIPAGGSAWSVDTFTVEVDLTVPGVDPCEEVFWRIEYDDAAGVHHVVENVPQFPPGEGPSPCP